MLEKLRGDALVRWVKLQVVALTREKNMMRAQLGFLHVPTHSSFLTPQPPHPTPLSLPPPPPPSPGIPTLSSHLRSTAFPGSKV